MPVNRVQSDLGVRARRAGRAFQETKKALRKPEGHDGKGRNYFAPRIASFAAFATRNFTTRLAGIWMVAPVIGLRP